MDEDPDLRAELRRYTVLDTGLKMLDQGDLEDVDYDAHRADIIAAVERKALLEGPPRRRLLLLRPRPVMLAAAAVLLILASVAVVTFQSAGPDGPVGLAGEQTELSVAVLPETAPNADGEELFAELTRLEADEFDLVPPVSDTPAVAFMPAGTVLVSVGPRREVSQSFFPAEILGVTWIE